MTDIIVSVGAWCKNLEICGSSSITCFSAVFTPFLINMTWNKKQKRPWSKHRLHVSCVVLTKQLSQTLTNPYQHLPYLPAIEALSTSLHFLFSWPTSIVADRVVKKHWVVFGKTKTHPLTALLMSAIMYLIYRGITIANIGRRTTSQKEETLDATKCLIFDDFESKLICKKIEVDIQLWCTDGIALQTAQAGAKAFF